MQASTAENNEVPHAQGKQSRTEVLAEPLDPSANTSEAHDAPKSRESLPNWTPPSLSWLPYVLCLLRATIAAYIGLFAWSQARGLICHDTAAAEAIFLHGPTLLGLVLGELLGRIAADLGSIRPYQKLGRVPEEPRRVGSKAGQYLLTQPADGIGNKLQRWVEMQNYASVSAFWATLILVPVLASTFQLGSRQVGSSAADFRFLDIDKLISSLNGTMMLSVGLPAFVHSPIFNDLRWFSSFDASGVLTNPSYFGVMPFAPVNYDTAQSGPNGDLQTWSATTTVLYGSLECAPVALQVTVSALSVGSQAQADIQLDLDDNKGCRLSSSFQNITNARPASLDNPIVLNGTAAVFALWATSSDATTERSGLPAKATINGNCGSRHFIVSGSLESASGSGPTTTYTDGWSALTCTSSYFTKDHVQRKVDPTVAGIQGADDVSPENGTPVSEYQKAIVDAAMLANFVSPGNLYKLSEFIYNYNFWRGQPSGGEIDLAAVMNGVANGLQSLFGGEPTPLDCSSIASPEGWKTEDCEAYIVVSSLWSFLVAGIPMVQAPFLGADGWARTQGSLTHYSTGWFLDSIEFAIAVIFLMILLVALLLSRLVGHKQPTGLYGTVTSIAGLAFAFRLPSTRSLFRGIDALENEKATHELRKMMYASKITLSLGGSPNAVVASAPAYYGGHDQVHATNRPLLKKLMRGSSSLVLRWWFLLVVALILSAVVVVVFVCIVTPDRTLLKMFDVAADGTSSAEQARRFGQRLLFAGLPPLFLTLVASIWWSEVDSFFRRTQPFAALTRRGGASAAKSIELTYMHDFHGVVTARALRHGHWALALVTAITLLGKIGVFLSAGIFKLTTAVATSGAPISFSSYWRNGTFPAARVSGLAYPARFQRLFMALLVLDYSAMYAWKTERYHFPSLVLELPWYQMEMEGLAGWLSCEPVKAIMSYDDGTREWTSTLAAGPCTGSEWKGSLGPRIANTSYMAWVYLDRSSCKGLGANESGMWWIQNALVSRGDRSQEVTSLVCAPHFSLDSIQLTVQAGNIEYVDDDVPPVLHIGNVTAHRPVDANHWMARGTENELREFVSQYGRDSTSFATFVSNLLNSTLSAGKLQEASPALFVDYLSMMALTLQGNTTGNFVSPQDSWLLSPSELAALSDRVFGVAANIVFATGLEPFTIDSTTRLGTTLLQQNSSLPAPWSARPNAQVASLQPGALYAALAVVLLYLAAILVLATLTLLPGGGGWRPPRDLAYAANVVSMIYDSTVVEWASRRRSEMILALRGGRTDEEKKDTKNTHMKKGNWKPDQENGGETFAESGGEKEPLWGFGVFRGTSGPGFWRVGIERVDNILTDEDEVRQADIAQRRSYRVNADGMPSFPGGHLRCKSHIAV